MEIYLNIAFDNVLSLGLPTINSKYPTTGKVVKCPTNLGGSGTCMGILEINKATCITACTMFEDKHHYAIQTVTWEAS